MRLPLKYISLLFIAVALALGACSTDGVDLEDALETTTPSDSQDNTDSETLAMGFELFGFELPMLDRFEDFIEQNGVSDVAVELCLKGRTITDIYRVTATLSVEDGNIVVNSTDEETLSLLYHQEYILHYISASGATRSSEDIVYPDGAAVVEAILSAEDPNNIYIASSFSTTSSVSGSGTNIDPYIIASVSNFMTEVADKVNGGDSLDEVYFLQSQDLSFSDTTLSPIGRESQTAFNGLYDGGMMNISHIKINDSSNDNVALFYKLNSKGIFCNSILSNNEFSGKSYVGVVAAQMDSSNILNVFVESTEVTSTVANAGGLVGAGYGTIANCTFRGTVNGVSNCGGFIGSLTTYDTIEFFNCVFNGTVIATSVNAGGLVGLCSDIFKLFVKTVCVSGTIVAKDNSTGGLVGKISHFDFCNIYSASIGYNRSTDETNYTNGDLYEAPITLDDTDMDGNNGNSEMLYVGGLIGYLDGVSADYGASVIVDDSKFSNNTNNKVTVRAYVGGAIGYANRVNLSSFIFTNYTDIGSIVDANDSSDLNESNTGGVIGCADYVTFTDYTIYLENHGDISGTKRYVGGLIGAFTPDVTISNYAQYANLSNYGNVIGTLDNIGGCIGVLNNDKSSDSSNLEILYKNYGVISGRYNVGGFVGLVYGDPGIYPKTDNNYNGYGNNAYNVTISGDTSVGGFFGKLHVTSTTPSYIYVYGKSAAMITASLQNAGGIFGQVYFDSGSISNRVINIYSKEGENTVNVSAGCYAGGYIGNIASECSSMRSIEVYSYDHITANSTVAVTGSGGDDSGAGGVVGAIVGNDNAIDVNFKYCYNLADVRVGTMYGAGGILGYIDASSSSPHFTYCCNWGEIEGSEANGHSGGILGYADGASDVHITACYNGGDITTGDHRGGLIGRIELYTRMESCFNMGSVVNTENSCVAGLIGSIEADGNDLKIEMSNCYNIGVAGWGIIGGEDKLADKDCSNDYVYYLDTASPDGDLNIDSDNGYDDAKKLTASQMASSSEMPLTGSYYAFPSDRATAGNLPYISSITYYESKPKVSL